MQQISRIHKWEDKLIKKEKSYRNIRLGGFFLFILAFPAILLAAQGEILYSTLMAPVIKNEYITISDYFFTILYALFWGVITYSSHMKLRQIESIKYYREQIAELRKNK